MSCLMRFFSKSNGFNPTTKGNNENSKSGRYTKKEEAPPPISIGTVANGKLPQEISNSELNNVDLLKTPTTDKTANFTNNNDSNSQQVLHITTSEITSEISITDEKLLLCSKSATKLISANLQTPTPSDDDIHKDTSCKNTCTQTAEIELNTATAIQNVIESNKSIVTAQNDKPKEQSPWNFPAGNKKTYPIPDAESNLTRTDTVVLEATTNPTTAFESTSSSSSSSSSQSGKNSSSNKICKPEEVSPELTSDNKHKHFLKNPLSNSTSPNNIIPPIYLEELKRKQHVLLPRIFKEEYQNADCLPLQNGTNIKDDLEECKEQNEEENNTFFTHTDERKVTANKTNQDNKGLNSQEENTSIIPERIILEGKQNGFLDPSQSIKGIKQDIMKTYTLNSTNSSTLCDKMMGEYPVEIMKNKNTNPVGGIPASAAAATANEEYLNNNYRNNRTENEGKSDVSGERLEPNKRKKVKAKTKGELAETTSSSNTDANTTSKQVSNSGVLPNIKETDTSQSGQKKGKRNKGDELNPPAESRGRKEGVIYSRPNLSEGAEKVIKAYEKDQDTRKLIRNAIEANDFLNNYMDEGRKEMVIDAMEPRHYEAGSYIIRENEEGSEIYVSEEGIFDVIKNDEIINTLGSGIVFGELAILYNAKRFASIKAATKVKVWKISRSIFRTIMLISGSKEREENLNFLKSAPLLKDLNQDVLLKVVDLLKRVFFPSNTCIVRQGDIGNDFFIIRGGSVTIKKTKDFGEERIVDRRRRGDYFGEQALLNADKRQASVYADPPGTECLKLDRESFISYLGTIPELRTKPVDKVIIPELKRPSAINRKYDHYKLSDFHKVATLGAGAFGRVDLVLHKETQKTFALKVIKKIEVIKQEQIEHVYSEKLVMTMCQKCPFIVELFRTFRDQKYVYFLMEVCLGGDVWTIMHQRKFFDERTSKFISACVVEAFNFLHERNIVYRDLKPENLMLTTDGYCKLVDFGFAKRLNPNYKTNTFAGTPEYVAPEIILDRGHDRAVDYWALGILIHELLVGKPPFRGQSHIKIYQQILGGIEAVKMPGKIPRPAQGLIKHLCKQSPAERLGYQKKGVGEIKKHSWFENFDWEKLKQKKLNSPIKRPITGPTDLSYFSPCIEDQDIPPDETSGWDSEF